MHFELKHCSLCCCLLAQRFMSIKKNHNHLFMIVSDCSLYFLIFFLSISFLIHIHHHRFHAHHHQHQYSYLLLNLLSNLRDHFWVVFVSQLLEKLLFLYFIVSFTITKIRHKTSFKSLVAIVTKTRLKLTFI